MDTPPRPDRFVAQIMFGDDALATGRVRVKICGITNAADAAAAIDAGADALGFNCYKRSKRFIDLSDGGDWILQLPTSVKRIAVVVNPTYEEAVAIARLPFIDGLQLHGQESQTFCETLANERIVFAKALPVVSENSFDDALKFCTRTLVLDSVFAGSFGGTGTTFPWEIARSFVERHRDLQVILAGGLTPQNVAEAVRVVRPFAVDVTTSLESSPGQKDRQRLRDFIAAAHAA